MAKLYNYTSNMERVLDVIIENPKTIYRYDDFKSLRENYTGYSRIMGALSGLKKEKILKDPRFLKQKTKENQYELSNTSTAFNKILKVYQKKGEVNKFLKSKYIDYAIDKISFLKIYKIVRHDLINSDFKKISSRSLLNQPATIAEYKNLANSMKRQIIGKCSLDLSEIESNIKPDLIESISVLNNFDPLEAVRLYRKSFHEVVLNAYKDLASKGLITEGLHSFMAFDAYLSPLTSFPTHDVIHLLLSPQPFHRIYEDAYLLDGEAFKLFSSRAAALYNHFVDILFEIVKDKSFNPKELQIFVKQMIFNWNVASTRFDLICNELNEIYGECPSFGKYHIKSKGFGLEIIDLEKGRSLLPQDVSENILLEGLAPMIVKNSKRKDPYFKIMRSPFDYLRPCITFKDLNWNSEFIPIEIILSDLNTKLGDHITDNRMRNLSYMI